MGKQDRVARENVGLKIIPHRPADQLLWGIRDRSTVLFKYWPVFAAGEKPVYTGR